MKKTEPRPGFEAVFYTDIQIEQFYRSMRELSRQLGCTYLGYFVEDLKKRTRLGFASNPDWQREYVGERLIEQCHLWKNVNDQFIETKRDFLVFPWDSVGAKSSREKEICLYRTENGIGANGISFCSRGGSVREFFAIAPDTKNPSFLHYVSKNMDLIREQIQMFRQAAFAVSSLQSSKECQ